jgi:hypothetical protein
LKQALTDLPEGQLDLDTAYNFFSEFGINDDDLENKFQQAKSLDSATDPIQVFQVWAKESYPELLVALGMSGTQAPEQPVGEGLHPMVIADIEKLATLEPASRYSAYGNIRGYLKADPELSKMASDLQGGYYEADMLRGKYKTDAAKAKYAELEPMHQAFIKQAHGAVENTDMVPPPGAMENSQFVVWYMIDDGEWDKRGTFNNEADADAYVQQLAAKGYDDDNFEVLKPGQHPDDDYAYTGSQENTDMVPPPGAMEEDKGSMTKQVAEKVKSFYNISNEDVAPFRAEENIATDIKKEMEEQFGEEAAEQAHDMALAFMQKKNQEWQQKHGKVAAGHGDDGLARLKELVGNIKSKVEGIGDQGMGGRDFNKNIMPSEEGYNPNSVDAEHRRDLEASHEKRLKDKAASGDKGAQSRLDALAQKKERMKNDYDARMERESTEMESILRLAGLAK